MAMGLFVAILLCVLAVTCLGQSTKHMICKDVDNVFDDVATTGVARRRHIGPAGKPGLPGMKGESGEIDYDRLEKIVHARVSEETQRFESRFDEMNAKIQNMTQTIPEARDLELSFDEMNEKIQNMTQTISAMCDGVIYGGKCFWAEIEYRGHINLTEAQEFCRKRGCRLADIYGKHHYNIVIEYLRSKLNAISSVTVWTGMKRIYGNPNAQLSNNIQAPYTKATTISSRWNTAARARDRVYLNARKPSNTKSEEGMYAGEAYWSLYGGLCQSL